MEYLIKSSEEGFVKLCYIESRFFDKIYKDIITRLNLEEIYHGIFEIRT